MKFATYFRSFSYAMIAVAMLALVLAGGLSYGLALVFLVVMIVSWLLEETRWQLPERIGLGIVLLSIPLFYLDWQYQQAIGEPIERLGVNALAHLIVFLSAVKLLQVKKDRDWVFLYLISFFEVLLAAGLSFSPMFLVTLSMYLLAGLSAVTAFEIQKARRVLPLAETRLLVPPDSRRFKKTGLRRFALSRTSEAARLPFVALLLLFLIFVLALPLFLIAPRSGMAAITRSAGGLTNFIGFSENVSLGEIGELKQDDALVMRVKVDQNLLARRLRWRGVALDEFTGRGWRKSVEAKRGGKNERGDRGFFPLDTTEALDRLTTQTFFLEPLELPVLFAAHRVIAIQGDLPFVRVDGEGSLQGHRHEFERVIYKAYSDINEPHPEQLRADIRRLPVEYYRYTDLPETTDPRISALANAMIVSAQARNRYDAAKAIESQLQIAYGYSLQMTASGQDPLADFLFNVKSGHCEYFSTAMAVMLRTKGIAARVVNGFLPGEYNETAGAYTVRQSDAHSWVEVYFPETGAWVTFDPTPAAGRAEPVRTGLAAQLQKYGEALELIWFQYVVGYDQQEQRVLATNVTNQVAEYGQLAATLLTSLRNALPKTPGSILVFGLGLVLALVLLFLIKRISRLGWRRGLQFTSSTSTAGVSAVVFYERLLRLLARKGWQREKHLTPLEFAGALKSREAILITRAYNRVRFGNERLSKSESREIEKILSDLESTSTK
jgi:protein-glutamine gamma-glutamyltransferase